jgi:parvulin-like peptidyl-prolyl isomerase
MSTPKQPKEQHDSSQHHRSTGKTLTYVATVILLIIVVVAFVGTPAVGGLAGGSRISFGSYAGRDIDYQPGNYLARQYQDLAARVQQQDQEITESLVRQIWQTAFQRTVYHEALMVLAEEANVSVSAGRVDRAIALWPEFQVDGRFSSERFNNTSSQYRLALRDYLRESLIDSRIQSDLYGETTPSAPEREFLVSMAGPERRFRFVQFSFDDFPDAEVVDYGRQNAKRFNRINLSVISINSSESDARQIREQAVNRQTSFEDLARNQSVDVYSSDGGEMGWVYYHELEPDFEDTAVIDEIFELEDGEISRVFETTFGWTIYRVNEEPIEPDFADPGVIDAVRDYLTVFERGLIEDYLDERGREFVLRANSDGFDAASAEIDQSPELTEYFPVNYGNIPYFGTVNASANPALSNGAFREDFFLELFALSDGEISEPIVLRDYVFVFQLDDERETEADTREFLDSYISLIIRELVQEQVQETVIDDELLVDNFNATYNRAILGN